MDNQQSLEVFFDIKSKEYGIFSYDSNGKRQLNVNKFKRMVFDLELEQSSNYAEQ